MSSAIRNIWAEHDTESKKQKKKTATERLEGDRLSDLPEALQFRILGFLDKEQAVQTTTLSRSWLSLWTRIPVLQFNRFSFPIYLLRFHNYFITRVPYQPSCNAEFLRSVFIEEVCGDDSWPISLCDSLTSLKLQKQYQPMRCPAFLGPRSILFKNLSVLYLEGALITDVEPFSGFSVLERLTLLDCNFHAEGDYQSVRVRAPQLSDLTISNCSGVQFLDLRTPRLRFLEYDGYELLKHEGLPVLETLEINFDGFRSYYRDKEAEKRMIDDLMSLFSTLPPNIKSLTLFPATIILLSLFPDELVRRGSPFQELKDLKLDLNRYYTPRLFHKPYNEWYNSVKAYLFHSSPDAEFTITYPEDIDDVEWFDDDPWETLLMQLIYSKN